jgi:hypothetical protein
MATTYTLINSTTVGSGGASNVTFSSIPATYTDLVVEMSGRDSDSAAWETINIQFNTDATSSNYSNKSVFGTGSSASSQNGNQFAGYVTTNGNTANTFGNSICYISNYLSSNQKSWSWDAVTENNATAALAILGAGLWNGTAAINSIKLTSTGSGFVQYSTFYLYGINNS